MTMESELKTALGPLGAMGNQPLQQRILNYLKAERIHPGIILSGPNRDITSRVARGMAKFILCRNNKPLLPEKKGFCGICSNCKRIEKGIHPDVILLSEDSEDCIKVSHIREICHQMEISPLEGVAKVGLLEDCHRMNSAAANAFLKTLEEPGANRFFILTTHKVGSLLPTILSRCLQFSFRPEPGHNPGEEENLNRFSELLNKVIQSKNPSELLTALKEKEQCLNFVKFIQKTLRDGILAKANPQLSSLPPTAFSLLHFEEVVELENRLQTNTNPSLLVEAFLRKTIFEESDNPGTSSP